MPAKGGRTDAPDDLVKQAVPAVRPNQDVLGLDIPMDDAVGVGEGERGEDREKDVHGLGGGHRPTLRHHLAKGVATEELHDDVCHAVVRAGIEHADDAGVCQPGRGHGLRLEPLVELGIPGQVVAEDLDCDRTGQDLVDRAPQGRHPAAGDHFLEDVSPRQSPLGRDRSHDGPV